MQITRLELVAKLGQAMRDYPGWFRVHAAEALLDNEEPGDVAKLFQPEADNAAPHRIGVWRVLARSASHAERPHFVEKIRSVLHDPGATDRISAAESLGKLNAASAEDHNVILNWLRTADDAAAVFPRWLLVLSSTGHDREIHERALTKLLASPDPVARLRTGFALGRLKNLSSDSTVAIRRQLDLEPADSIARVYLITALLLHCADAAAAASLKKELLPYLQRKANEQLEAGIVIGLLGEKSDSALLLPLLDNPELDARNGGANGMLRLLK